MTRLVTPEYPESFGMPCQRWAKTSLQAPIWQPSEETRYGDHTSRPNHLPACLVSKPKLGANRLGVDVESPTANPFWSRPYDHTSEKVALRVLQSFQDIACKPRGQRCLGRCVFEFGECREWQYDASVSRANSLQSEGLPAVASGKLQSGVVKRQIHRGSELLSPTKDSWETC